MSAISEKVRTALYAKLNVSGVTNLATGGVHFQVAPDDKNVPYVIFNRQAAREVNYTFGFTLSHEDDLWMVKAVTDKDSSRTKSPPQLAQEMLAAAETAIGTTLTLTGNETWMVQRVQDAVEYIEKRTDRLIHHHGFLLRVVTG